MKNRKSQSRPRSDRRLASLFVIALALTSSVISPAAFSSEGGTSSGGGDDYTLDFVKVATQTVFPWLVANGSKLNPPVDANAFLMAISPKDIESKDQVYESCDDSNKGREVTACFNFTTGKFFISRRLYQIDSNSSSKIGLVAHEIFRKMGIEGDDYEVTKQMPIASNDQSCAISSGDFPELVRFGMLFSKVWHLLESKGFKIVTESSKANYSLSITWDYYYHNPLDKYSEAWATLKTPHGRPYETHDITHGFNIFSSSAPSAEDSILAAVDKLPECKDTLSTSNSN